MPYGIAIAAKRRTGHNRAAVGTEAPDGRRRLVVLPLVGITLTVHGILTATTAATAPIIASATSCGPTPGRGSPVM